jgi:hypothetical protein
MRNVHPRCTIVETAQLDFWNLTIEFKKKHGDLTPIEWLGILDNEIGTTLKYALRQHDRQTCTGQAPRRRVLHADSRDHWHPGDVVRVPPLEQTMTSRLIADGVWSIYLASQGLNV